ncbi:MAG: S8 family serine peptidase, partial [FCB group bacterium]|nr:S8 family serine peptidase [FCB group bacterium]
MKYTPLLIAVLLTCTIGATENIWIDYAGNKISANKIIVKLTDEIAPKLGSEAPAVLADIPGLEAVLAGQKTENFKPLFRNFNTFTTDHYQQHLHQYYYFEFETRVDVVDLKNKLLSLDSIEAVDLNYQVNIATVPNDTYYPDQWAHDNQGQAGPNNVGVPDCDMDTDEAWDIEQGSEDVIIAILDTGINSHVEFTGKLLQGYNSVNGGSNTNDVFGHGSFCAGIAAARGNNGVGVAGVAWESKLLPVKVLTDSGYGDQIDLADGIQWATDNGADVISMSLQFGQDFVNVCNDAINYAVSNGTTVLAAAGNFDSSPVTFPAQYENCICVGGLSPCNERKSYGSCDGENFWGSNYGADLDFLTPCVLINTTTNS